MKENKIIFALFFCFSFKLFAETADKIIGKNDLVEVNIDGSNIPLKYKNLLDAFGQTSEVCTATHIGNGYVITAGHCFWATEVLMEHVACNSTQISWGVRADKKANLISQCIEIVAAQRNKFGDFAVIKVAPIPDVFILPDLTQYPVPSDVITIFSHPDGLPLHWSSSCQIEKAVDPHISKEFIQHQCDTNPGSSGAAIINANSLKIIGIHDGGYVTSDHGMNYGTYIMQPQLMAVLKELGFN